MDCERGGIRSTPISPSIRHFDAQGGQSWQGFLALSKPGCLSIYNDYERMNGMLQEKG